MEQKIYRKFLDVTRLSFAQTSPDVEHYCEKPTEFFQKLPFRRTSAYFLMRRCLIVLGFICMWLLKRKGRTFPVLTIVIFSDSPMIFCKNVVKLLEI